MGGLKVEASSSCLAVESTNLHALSMNMRHGYVCGLCPIFLLRMPFCLHTILELLVDNERYNADPEDTFMSTPTRR